MQLTLRGDYFNGKFTAPNGLTGSEKSDEEIRRICPGDLDLTLWRAQINYENIEKVLESSNNGFKAWYLSELCFSRSQNAALILLIKRRTKYKDLCHPLERHQFALRSYPQEASL